MSVLSETKIATRNAYGSKIEKLGSDERVIVMDADLSKSTMTAMFAKTHPMRFIQMGISEQDMMGTAAGLASCGKIVFVSTFAMFAAGRAWEQVRNSICYPDLSVKVCATHSGITVGEDGGSHQALEDIALMRVLPNMKVLVPSDAVSTEEAVRIAYETDGPFYVRLGRLAVPVIYEAGEHFELGKGKVVSEGKDVTLIACGLMVSEAIKAAESLKKSGISARVIDIFSIKPLDTALVEEAARETRAIVTCEEHSVIGGLFAAVTEHLSSVFPVPVIKVGIKDTFGKSGKPLELLDKFGLTAHDIEEAAINALVIKNKNH